MRTGTIIFTLSAVVISVIKLPMQGIAHKGITKIITTFEIEMIRIIDIEIYL